jgi:hypothetical protein
MATTENIVQLAVDCWRGTPAGGFSLDQSTEALRQGLIAANGGKNYLDIRDIRDGKCGALFAIIEEVITRTVIDGLQGNEFFMNMVDYRNLALGDKNEFYTPDRTFLNVATIARGTQGVRRQRINGGTTVTIDTKTYAVKVYEELDRVLAGRASLNELITKVGEALLKKQYDDIYAAWVSIGNATGTTYIPTAGSYDETAFLELCEHVEANNDVIPIIMGTRAALRKITTAVVSDSAKEDMYNMGYYGRVNGYAMIRIKNLHQTNTDTFLLPDDKIYVIGTNIKPIKYVNEGQSLIINGAIDKNADFTQEYFISNKAGVSVIMPDKQIGIYTIS